MLNLRFEQAAPFVYVPAQQRGRFLRGKEGRNAKFGARRMVVEEDSGGAVGSFGQISASTEEMNETMAQVGRGKIRLDANWRR
ncbi:hypothetical protein A0H81_05997 [Grifola frondosa]|uniref:Uncharacterized protein n=1 Tax=Grifola frondosa TaxID=5627 RepID=A0A1C7M9I9_GRIFR|nr:hypothetical protein A0H81_05997 [Grifola frondosa]